MKVIKCASALLAAALVAQTATAENVVNVYNWSDYIDEETVPAFEKATGMRVRYDLFDGMATLETKLLTGNSGYDVVVPTSATAERMIQVGALAKLDRSKLGNWDNLDAGLMAELAGVDPGNEHVVPYMWGTVGLMYNVEMVKERLGEDAPTDSLDLVFKPEYSSKLKDCGVGMIDQPSEVAIIALNYLGLDPYSGKKADLQAAEDLLMGVRDNFRYIKGTGYLDDLGNGEICLFLGYSVDAFQVMWTLEENGEDPSKLAFEIPKEGTVIYFDTLAIPSDAPNPDAAHAFINHIMDAQIAANLSNYLWSANGNAASNALLDPELLADTSVYPVAEVQAKLKADKTVPQKVARARTRMMTKIKTGQ